MKTAGIDKGTKISTDFAYYDFCNTVLRLNLNGSVLLNNESPIGCLKSCLQHWKMSGASDYILDIVDKGKIAIEVYSV